MADVAEPMRVRRLDLGYVAVPEQVPGGPRVADLLAYLVRQGDVTTLFDTGLGSDAEMDALLQPRRRSLPDALGAAGVRLSDVSIVVNCHLHFDHCGGNPSLPGCCRLPDTRPDTSLWS